MKFFLNILVFLSITMTGFAQTIEEEFPFDDESYSQQDEILNYGYQKWNSSEIKRVRNFCTIPSNLTKFPTGMSLSIAIAHAMTIQYAQKNRWSKSVMEKEAFSNYFLWDMLNKKNYLDTCKLQKGYVKQIEQILEEMGNVKANDYPTMKPCGIKPDFDRISHLKKYRVKEFCKLITERRLAVSEKIYAIKRCINRNHPAILVMSVETSFRNLKGTKVWIPSKSPQLFKHTVLVIGYDTTKQMLEIFNPAWGSQWGNGGFAFVRYQDMVYANYAWELMINNDDEEIVVNHYPTKVKSNERMNAISINRPSTKHQNKKIKQVIGYNTEGEFKLNVPVFDNDNNYTFRQVGVSKNGYVFEPNEPWRINKQFQLVSNGTEGKYVYVFSIDPKGKAEIHFPKNVTMNNLKAENRPISPIIADKDIQIVIPEPTISYNENGNQKIIDNALTQVHEGTDWVIVLYTDKRIDEKLPAMVKSLANHQQDLEAKFKEIFGENLVEESKLKFQGNSMRFKAKTDEKRFIIPIILKTVTK